MVKANDRMGCYRMRNGIDVLVDVAKRDIGRLTREHIYGQKYTHARI